MSPISLARRHKGYDALKDRTRFLECSYLGGEAYRELELLRKHPREDPADYRQRLEHAYYANYVARVVDAYIAEVFRRDPVRELSGERLETFAEDATLAGQSLTDLSQETLTWALATGIAYLGVDLENDTPYVHRIHPENVLDYSVDRTGAYRWAMIAEKVTIDEDPEVARREERRVRLWTRERWTLYDAQGRALDADANTSGVVPLIEVDGSQTRLPIQDIAEANRRIYNVDSQRDEILVNLTFPQMHMTSELPRDESGQVVEGTEESLPIEIGTGRVLLLPPGTSNPPGFTVPPDGPVIQHREEKAELRRQIFELAGLERRDPDSQTVQSGVAKAYDFRETNARLANAASLIEDVEHKIFALLSAFGINGADAANVTYQKDFNATSFEAQLESYLKLAGAPLPAELKRMAAKDLAGVITEERTDEEKREARDAVDAMRDQEFVGGASRRGALDRLLNNADGNGSPGRTPRQTATENGAAR